MNKHIVTEEIPAELDVSMLGRSARTLLAVALSLGWTPRATRNSICIYSPWGEQQIMLPARNSGIREARFQGWARTIGKYADPEKMIHFARNNDRAAFEAEFLAQHLTPEGRLRGVKQVATPAPRPAPRGPRPVPADPGDSIIRTGLPPVPDLPQPPPPPTGEPVLLSVEPRMAHKGHARGAGKYYTSQTTLERHWRGPDGTESTDFACSHPGCDYSHENHRMVANHYAKSKDHPKLGDVKQEQVQVGPAYEEGPSHPRHSTGTSRLAQRIVKALEGLDRNAEDFALQLAARLREDQLASIEPSPSAPLTPEQILERVRSLVDRGETMAARDARVQAEEQLAAVQAELGDLRQRALAAEQERDTIRSEWDALVSIIQRPTAPAGS